jgi:hypothetical protein
MVMHVIAEVKESSARRSFHRDPNPVLVRSRKTGAHDATTSTC